jgi:hypothetical protein
LMTGLSPVIHAEPVAVGAYITPYDTLEISSRTMRQLNQSTP